MNEKRITIKWRTNDPADLIFAERAVKYMEANPTWTNSWLLYGEPPKVRVPIRRTSTGYSMVVEAITDFEAQELENLK